MSIEKLIENVLTESTKLEFSDKKANEELQEIKDDIDSDIWHSIDYEADNVEFESPEGKKFLKKKAAKYSKELTAKYKGQTDKNGKVIKSVSVEIGGTFDDVQIDVYSN